MPTTLHRRYVQQKLFMLMMTRSGASQLLSHVYQPTAVLMYVTSVLRVVLYPPKCFSINSVQQTEDNSFTSKPEKGILYLQGHMKRNAH